jgi:hypothetical protein
MMTFELEYNRKINPKTNSFICRSASLYYTGNMKTNLTISLSAFLALLAMQPAFAGSLRSLQDGDAPQSVIQVEDDCYAVGQDKAAELGGELAKASPDTAEGAPVCRVVILIPGKDGERPQRVAMDIPQ